MGKLFLLDCSPPDDPDWALPVEGRRGPSDDNDDDNDDSLNSAFRQNLSVNASIFTLTAIAVDRYKVIFYNEH